MAVLSCNFQKETNPGRLQFCAYEFWMNITKCLFYKLNSLLLSFLASLSRAWQFPMKTKYNLWLQPRRFCGRLGFDKRQLLCRRDNFRSCHLSHCHAPLLFQREAGQVKFLSFLKYSFARQVLIQMLHLFLHYLVQRFRRFQECMLKTQANAGLNCIHAPWKLDIQSFFFEFPLRCMLGYLFI